MRAKERGLGVWVLGVLRRLALLRKPLSSETTGVKP